MKEVYVLRDVLIHSHLWEIDYQYGGSHSMVLKRPTMSRASGDNKYHARVNPMTHRTKALRASALPTRINRTDVRKVFETVWKTLLRFERVYPNRFAISNQHVRFRGKHMRFDELRNLLNTTGVP